MNLNPLFFDKILNSDSAAQLFSLRPASSQSYLFSDIIKICEENIEVDENATANPQLMSLLQLLSHSGLINLAEIPSQIFVEVEKYSSSNDVSKIAENDNSAVTEDEKNIIGEILVPSENLNALLNELKVLLEEHNKNKSKEKLSENEDVWGDLFNTLEGETSLPAESIIMALANNENVKLIFSVNDEKLTLDISPQEAAKENLSDDISQVLTKNDNDETFFKLEQDFSNTAKETSKNIFEQAAKQNNKIFKIEITQSKNSEPNILKSAENILEEAKKAFADLTQLKSTIETNDEQYNNSENLEFVDVKKIDDKSINVEKSVVNNKNISETFSAKEILDKTSSEVKTEGQIKIIKDIEPETDKKQEYKFTSEFKNISENDSSVKKEDFVSKNIPKSAEKTENAGSKEIVEKNIVKDVTSENINKKPVIKEFLTNDVKTSNSPEKNTKETQEALKEVEPLLENISRESKTESNAKVYDINDGNSDNEKNAPAEKNHKPVKEEKLSYEYSSQNNEVIKKNNSNQEKELNTSSSSNSVESSVNRLFTAEANLSNQKKEQKQTKSQNAESLKVVSAEESNTKTESPNEQTLKITDNKEYVKGFGTDSQLSTDAKTNHTEVFKTKVAADFKDLQETVKTIKTTEVLSELTKHFQSTDKQSMTFQLTPENLGKIRLVIDYINNKLTANIEVENEQIKQFIQSNVEQLKTSLQSAGIQLSGLNINLGDNEQRLLRNAGLKRKNYSKMNNLKVEKRDLPKHKKMMGYNTYDYLA